MSAIGQPHVRPEGRLKVMGAARYPSDDPVARPAYAFLVTSAIAKGRIRAIHLDEAKQVRGVLDILTHENTRGKIKTPKGPDGGKQTTTLESDKIWHDGQIVAVVVADTYERAREAAYRVRIDYAPEDPAATFGSSGAEEESLAGAKEHEDPKVGDAEGAFAAAPVKIDNYYSTSTQHHNPMELFTTTCEWHGDQLTVHEPSQFVHGLRGGVAQMLSLKPDNVRVMSHLVGGAFGSKGGITARTSLIALAARRIGRPVKLVATRDQGFTIVTYRAETRQRIKLAASRDGKLQALVHEGREITSRPSKYNVSGTKTTTRVYACPNVASKVAVVHADRNTPGFMRSPPETPYMFALESAMDELAVALDMDPVELRRRNDTRSDPIEGIPYSSRSLMQCFDRASEAFGWSRRDPKPASMRDGDWLIGLGCATAAYPSHMGAAAARVTLNPDNTVKVQQAAQDIGNGATSVIVTVAADRLGVPVENVSVEIGDTILPPGGLAAGSTHTATIANAVAAACSKIKAQIAAGASRSSPIEAYAENFPRGASPDAIEKMKKGEPSIVHENKDSLRYAFGANFVEVRVHALTREVHVARMTGAFAAGTIVNPLTAKSQLMGGMIWGVQTALMEGTEIDMRYARYTNDNLADYLIAVNADIPEVEVILVPEEDSVINPLGIKGLGELGNVGMDAAVANAIYHATGIRVRKLPIRIETLLPA